MNPHVMLVALALIVSSPCLSGESVVFQIGDPDNSYREFAVGSDYKSFSARFSSTIKFRAGSDDPATSFPSIFPSASDDWAGGKQHTIEILFDVASAPSGVYKLKIDLADSHQHQPPLWDISVNDKRGLWRQTAGTGDPTLANPGLGREQALSLELPAALFRQGTNSISIKSVEGSWALFDCITLSSDPAVELKPDVRSLRIVQPERLVRSKGRLQHPLTIEAVCAPGTPAFDAKLLVGKISVPLKLEPDLMGVASAQALVDEVSGPTRVTLQARPPVAASLEAEIKPVRRWKLFVQPSTHVDIGYTGYQPDVRDFHIANIQRALDLADSHPSFVFNTEAAWVQENFLSFAAPAGRSQFLSAAQRGQIGCQAVYGNMLTGICSHEGLIRSLYYAAGVSRTSGIDFDNAMSSDVPTQVWTLPSVLAGAGIRYYAAGLNLTRGNSFDRLFSKSPFWWEGADGSRVLTWLWPGYAAASNVGLSAGIDAAASRIDATLASFSREDYPYDAVLAFGGFSDNVGLDSRLADIVEQWNAKFAYPQVILCRGPEFFRHIEQNFAGQIPTIRGDGGVYWEDGAASTAAETAMNRIAKEQLVTAEKLFSLTGGRYPLLEINRAWRAALLYDEHTWGAAASIDAPESPMTKKQWAYKAAFARQAAGESSDLLGRAMQQLAASVTPPENSIIVFNPHGHDVSGPVSVPLLSGEGRPEVSVPPLLSGEGWGEVSVPPLLSGEGWGEVSGLPLLSGEGGGEVLEPPLLSGEGRGEVSVPPLLSEEGWGEVSFWADDVPACGYKTFDITEISKRHPQPSPAPADLSFQNRFYKLKIDPATGAVSSLIDLTSGRELVDLGANAGLNQYIYWEGQGAAARDVTATTGVAVTEAAHPLGRQIIVTGSSFNTPQWKSTVILYENAPRIDFDNQITKTATYAKEAGYFAFPFKGDGRFHLELPNGVMQPGRDSLDGACMSWFAVQDFAAIRNGDSAVIWTPVESPLVTLCDINRDSFVSPLPLTNGRLFAYVFNNYWFTNYKAAQGGDQRFRFSITSQETYDPAAAARFGQQVRSPMVAISADARSGRSRAALVTTPPRSGRSRAASFCSVEAANVSIQAVKRPQSGPGRVIRLRELSGRPTTTVLRFDSPVFEVWKCNLVELPESKLGHSGKSVRVSIPASGMVTLLVK